MQARKATLECLSVAVLVAGFAFFSASPVLAEGPATEPVDPTSESSSGENEAAVAGKGSAGEERQVILYYFHGARRCKTCLAIEANALEVVKTEYAKELESGALAWKVVNYDEPENQHFLEDFGLVSASLVLVETHNGERVRFEILQQAWPLARDKWKFGQYVRETLLGYMG